MVEMGVMNTTKRLEIERHNCIPVLSTAAPLPLWQRERERRVQEEKTKIAAVCFWPLSPSLFSPLSLSSLTARMAESLSATAAAAAHLIPPTALSTMVRLWGNPPLLSCHF